MPILQWHPAQWGRALSRPKECRSTGGSCQVPHTPICPRPRRSLDLVDLGGVASGLRRREGRREPRRGLRAHPSHRCVVPVVTWLALGWWPWSPSQGRCCCSLGAFFEAVQWGPAEGGKDSCWRESRGSAGAKSAATHTQRQRAARPLGFGRRALCLVSGLALLGRRLRLCVTAAACACGAAAQRQAQTVAVDAVCTDDRRRHRRCRRRHQHVQSLTPAWRPPRRCMGNSLLSAEPTTPPALDPPPSAPLVLPTYTAFLPTPDRHVIVC